MFDRILLLTDVTDKPELCYQPLAVIAGVCASKVIIFHAVTGSSDLFYLEGEAARVRGLIDKQAQDRVMPVLEEIASDLEALGVNTGIVTQIGSTFDLAIRAIQDLDIDLVVIPQEGYADFTARILSSTTARIMRETNVPVLTCNEAFAARMQTWTGFGKVLHPVNFDTGGIEGIEAAEIFTAEFGGRLEMVHVVEPIHKQMLDTPEGSILLPKDLYYRQRSRLEARLSDVAHTVDKVPCAWRLLEDTKPGSGVMAYADRTNADLIIIPPIGRHSVRNTLMGSVAEHVIKHARCPVLTLREGNLD